VHLFQTLDHMPLTLTAEYDDVSGAFTELQNLMTLAYEDLHKLLQPICTKSDLFSGNSSTDVKVRDKLQYAKHKINESRIFIDDPPCDQDIDCIAVKKEVILINLIVFFSH